MQGERRCHNALQKKYIINGIRVAGVIMRVMTDGLFCWIGTLLSGNFELLSENLNEDQLAQNIKIKSTNNGIHDRVETLKPMFLPCILNAVSGGIS